MTTWKKEIEYRMEEWGDSWDNIESVVLQKRIGMVYFDDVMDEYEKSDKPWYDVEFAEGYGGTEGIGFRLWTKDRVYFPVQYDGSEWVGSVSRNPIEDESIRHFGGG